MYKAFLNLTVLSGCGLLVSITATPLVVSVFNMNGCQVGSKPIKFLKGPVFYYDWLY
jgi:hypothetical protein